jgi:Fic family protein
MRPSARKYIHERPDWPHFRFDLAQLAGQLASTRHRQGLFAGRVLALGFHQANEAVLEALTDEVQKSSEIEGEHLDRLQVRSSVARRLGIDVGALTPIDRRVEGVVEMTLDATQNYAAPLTAERLFAWHAAMFPTGWSSLHRIQTGAWRDDANGPMQVVSGAVGRERVHFQAPSASRLETEMEAFLTWFNGGDDLDPVLRSGLSHLWFVTIHPFDDGNGRIARAVADMGLARSESSGMRFYSMSAQIRKERKAYYDILESTQNVGMDVTAWMSWFLGCLDRAIRGAEEVIEGAYAKKRFWESLPDGAVNERQRLVLNRFMDKFDGSLTNRKWAAIAKCSPDTALRDIQDLLRKGILRKCEAKGRSSSYSLAEGPC